MTKSKAIRVLIAKSGLDGHDRGAKVIARALRDAGMQVTYTGIRQTPRMIVEAAEREEVEVVGLSSLSGGHMALFPEIIAGLNTRGMENVLIVAGGIISKEDRDMLYDLGVDAIYGPGSSLQEIALYIKAAVQKVRDK